MRNKKGQAVDIMFVVVFFFVFMLFSSMAYFFWANFNAEIQALPEDVIDNGTKEKINKMTNTWFFLDNIIPFFFIGLWGLVFLSSLTLNPEHPAFFIFAIITLTLTTFVAIIFVDVGTTLFNNPTLKAFTDQLNNINFFMKNYHYISFVMGLISTVFFFSRRTDINRGVQ